MTDKTTRGYTKNVSMPVIMNLDKHEYSVFIDKENHDFEHYRHITDDGHIIKIDFVGGQLVRIEKVKEYHMDFDPEYYICKKMKKEDFEVTLNYAKSLI